MSAPGHPKRELGPLGGCGGRIRAARPSECAHDSPHGRPKAGRVQLPTTALLGRGEALPAQWASLGDP